MKQKVLLFLASVVCLIVSGQNVYINTIKFQEFELNFINPLSVWDQEGKLKDVQKDTAFVSLELGESIEGIKIKINQLVKGDVKVYQRYENSITIMDEGPHCDLINWKHYNSEWKELEIKDDTFLTDLYSEKDRELFIPIDIKQLKNAVKQTCGENWENHIKNIQFPNDYPSAVGMSRIFLKIKLIKQDLGITKEKLISFEIPMGC